MADPARFRRGKALVADGSVTRVQVSSGELQATVMGSREHAVPGGRGGATAGTPAVGHPQQLRAQINRLTPEGDDLLTSCTRPDDGDRCKHAVAAAGLRRRAGVVPRAVVEFRCVVALTAPAHVGRGGFCAPVGERHPRLAPPPRSVCASPSRPPRGTADQWAAAPRHPPPDPPDVPPAAGHRSAGRCWAPSTSAPGRSQPSTPPPSTDASTSTVRSLRSLSPVGRQAQVNLKSSPKPRPWLSAIRHAVRQRRYPLTARPCRRDEGDTVTYT